MALRMMTALSTMTGSKLHSKLKLNSGNHEGEDVGMVSERSLEAGNEDVYLSRIT
jgi:hypothetical protein